MKLLVIIGLLTSVTSWSQTEIGFDGFGTFRMGKAKSAIEKMTKSTDVAPDYAWFQPMTMEEAIEEFGMDSLEYQQMRETDASIEEDMGVSKGWYLPKKKSDRVFFNGTIECMQLVFEDEKLIGMMIVLDSKGLTAESKEELLTEVEKSLGERWCSYSINNDPAPFYCGWDSNKGEIVISDMIEPGEGMGESINITFDMK